MPDPRESSRALVQDQEGNYHEVDRSQLDRDPNLRELTPADEAAMLRQQNRAREHDTVGSTVRAFTGGATDALTLGFVNPWKDDREFHPIASGLGQVAGIGATFLVPGGGAANTARLGKGAAVASDVARAAEAGASVAEISRASRLARTIGAGIERTPLGYANRIAESAGGLVRGSGVGSRIARSGLIGATGGGIVGAGTELSRQLLEADVEFSAENLLGSALEGAVLGGGIGVGGSAVSEGLSAAGRGVKALRARGKAPGTSADEFIEASSARSPRPYDESAAGQQAPRPPMASLLDPKRVSLIDGVSSRMDDLNVVARRLDDLTESPVLAKAAGLDAPAIASAQASIKREIEGLKLLSKADDAPLARMAEDAHLNDLTGVRLSKVTDRIPARWSDAERRAQSIIDRDRALLELERKRANGLPVSQAEEDAVRYSSQLSGGRSPTEQASIRDSLVADAARRLVSKLPGGGIISQGLGTAGGIGIAEHLISNGMSGLAGAAGQVALAGLAAKVVQAAFRDPHVGGLIAANVPSVLNSTGILRDSKRPTSSDPRKALRELGDRVRTVSPEQVNSATVTSLANVASASPVTLAKAGQAAATRHAQLLALLDRVDPRATTPSQAMLGRPLPSAQAARQVADFIRMAGSPTNFVVAALQGRLTPGMMAQAQVLWPATVRRARMQLSTLLAQTGGEGLSSQQRKSIETLLGSKTLGAPERSIAYKMAMQASAERGRVQPPQGGPRPGTVKMTQPEMSPAQKTANPGGIQ